MVRARVFASIAFVFALAAPAAAQVAVPVHNHTMHVGPATGGISLLAARVRSLLGVTNDSANTVYCTVDNTDAADGAGQRLNASGGSMLLDVKVPTGALRCYSGTAGSRINVMEGR